MDKVQEFGVTPEAAAEAVDTLIVNMRDVGLLRTLSGAERIVSIDMLLDELPSSSQTAPATGESLTNVGEGGFTGSDQSSFIGNPVVTAAQADFETTAFYISPIGEDGSETRQHADLFAASIVEPALAQSKLRLVRADQIDAPGVITKQIIEFIIRSRLVVVDLSYHNPNVFYELAIRHMLRKPTVQIARLSDNIPFDINQSRTIRIDDSSIYALVPKLEVHIAAISAQVRQALENPDAVDNPVSIYFPSLRAILDNQSPQ